jgi:hypothetical protein
MVDETLAMEKVKISKLHNGLCPRTLRFKKSIWGQ